ncbi:rhomboid family intramembrane serine protease [Halomicrococcus gelatinilyticus]|uniref:rhomboid family intramembrane serine protease n=1 Tax=Halomicrococcus gelatinilyticus TaxID=1702103 RepID=UPI002E12D9BC
MRTSGSPTVQTLTVFAVVFSLQSLVGLVAPTVAIGLFALAPPLTTHPWTLPLSVYAHASVPHLLSNSVALLFVGMLVERVTTTLRFHAFFASVGMAAGVSQVLLGDLFGPPTAVLGASGAVFGLFGYLLAGNLVTDAVLGRVELSPGVQVALVAAFALAVTATTAAPGVALIAHFTGLALGLVAGRLHILRVETQGTNNRRPV